MCIKHTSYGLESIANSTCGCFKESYNLNFVYVLNLFFKMSWTPKKNAKLPQILNEMFSLLSIVFFTYVHLSIVGC